MFITRKANIKFINIFLLFFNVIEFISFFEKITFTILIIEAFLIRIILIDRKIILNFSIIKKVDIKKISLKNLIVGGIPTFKNKIITHIMEIFFSILSVLLLEYDDRPSVDSYIIPIKENIIAETNPWEKRTIIEPANPIVFIDRIEFKALLIWMIEEVAASFLISTLRIIINNAIITVVQEILKIIKQKDFINSSIEILNLINPMILSLIINLAKTTDPIVKESTWALGSHMWKKNIGALESIIKTIIKPKIKFILFMFPHLFTIKFILFIALYSFIINKRVGIAIAIFIKIIIIAE